LTSDTSEIASINSAYKISLTICEAQYQLKIHLLLDAINIWFISD